jgi:RNA polymerase sigma factor (sigma-70 family)
MTSQFTELLAINSKNLKTLSYYLTKNQNDANDLYQETIVKILNNEGRFSQNTNFKAWAQTIMRNTFINYHRGMRKATFSVDSGDMQNGMYDNRLAHNDGENNIRLENLMNVINTLDERKRSIFLTYTKGYSYEEMVEMYQLNIQNLRGIVFSARQELQGKLSKMRMAA